MGGRRGSDWPAGPVPPDARPSAADRSSAPSTVGRPPNADGTDSPRTVRARFVQYSVYSPSARTGRVLLLALVAFRRTSETTVRRLIIITNIKYLYRRRYYCEYHSVVTVDAVACSVIFAIFSRRRFRASRLRPATPSVRVPCRFSARARPPGHVRRPPLLNDLGPRIA